MIQLNNGADVCDVSSWEDDGGNIPEVEDPPVCLKCYLRHDPDQNPLCEDALLPGGTMWRMVATEEELAEYEAEQAARQEAAPEKEEPVVNPAARKNGKKGRGTKDLSWQETFLAGASILALGGAVVGILYIIGVVLSGAIALIQSF